MDVKYYILTVNYVFCMYDITYAIVWLTCCMGGVGWYRSNNRSI